MIKKRRTINFKSRSKKEEVYQTRINKKGYTTCTCPGYTYVGKCWHVTRILELSN